jgi:hypothetical protein
MKIFVVPGYGLPKDVSIDPKYNEYLNVVFERISKFSSLSPKTKITIIFTGGNTDLDKPFNRTESGEMIKLFKKIGGHQIKNWNIKKEQKSLSTLENLVYVNKMLESEKISGNITIFCERSRSTRIEKVAREIFKNFTITPVDLLSEEQKGSALIKKKEKVALDYSLRALKDKESFKKYRKVFEDKIKILRGVPEGKREEALKQWWRDTIIKAEQQFQ